MNTLKIFICLIVLMFSYDIKAQDSFLYEDAIGPRVRVIIDNDFGGDPDGLFQLAHHVLSPSIEIRGIIGSHHYKNGFYGYPGDAKYATSKIKELLKIMRMEDKFSVYEGSSSSLSDIEKPIVSAGAQAIVKEALREDTKSRLYIVCGAGLTNIASALLMEPKIASKITLVWIGGPEYEGLAIAPPKAKKLEYNLGIDIKACQVVFNTSEIDIWQVPRNAYRQALYSYAELVYKIKSKGSTGKYLVEKLEELMKRANRSLGEAYVLGDNPLTLLTALQSSWEVDPSSSKYEIIKCPKILDLGIYEANTDGRKIRVYTQLDTRLIIDDLEAKLALLAGKE
jgi:inosine-uridine nucleoside N-ribohydrolase